MTDRTHGETMDSVYRYQRFIYDITRKYYLLGRDRMIDELDAAPGAHVLEVACGTGRNLIRIGQRYPDAQLYGFDISTEMLRTARASLDRAGMGSRVKLIQGDATRFDPAAMFGQPAFDRIVISYSLSMIPAWQEALTEAARHLAPGGHLAIVDFGQQGGLPSWFDKGLRRWLKAFHVTPRDGLRDAMHAAAAETGGSAALRSLYRDYAVIGRIDRPAA